MIKLKYVDWMYNYKYNVVIDKSYVNVFAGSVSLRNSFNVNNYGDEQVSSHRRVI